MFINGREISKNNNPYIIAELSANHNGSLERAKESIKQAYLSGADAIKIQSYTPETMTIKSEREDFKIKDGLWKGYQLFDLYKEAYTPFEWHKELFNFASNIGITIFSSPFDESAVDLLEELSTPAYKIASFELCDLPLIRYIAKTKKPILISTGMANLNEIDEAINLLFNNGYRNDNILLFHCISSYPAPVEQTNLRNIEYLTNKYSVQVGLSDHTNGNTALIASIALGATAIEKHFTLSRSDKGPDSAFSIEPNELSQLVKISKQTFQALGSENFSRANAEEGNKVFRRSLYFVKNLKKGEIVKEGDIKRIRPGFGLKPKYYEMIIGKKLRKDIKRGERVTWDSFEKIHIK